MKTGVFGLGRMGSNMCRRQVRAGHECVLFDVNDKPRASLSQEEATAVESLARMVQALQEKPCAIWIMLPAGEATEETVVRLSNLLESADIIVDGGNSYYKDDIRHAKTLRGHADLLGAQAILPGHHHGRDRPDVTRVYLKGSHDTIRRRVAARHAHFMPVVLLDSQLATLQEPTPAEHPIIVDVSGTPSEIAAVRKLRSQQSGGRRDQPAQRSAP
jgi:hypothetical protein